MNHLDKYQNYPFHPTMEKLVNILRKKTQNDNPMFFRLVVSYFFAKMASMMRTTVVLAEDQIIPVNMYAINLAPSGSGKGHSINIMEDKVIAGFRETFLSSTFPAQAEKNIKKIAVRRAHRDGESPEDVLVRTQMEFEEQGVLLFSFDSGTSAAIKQMRTKLLMAQAGSMNLEMDEIGSNFTGNTELLNAYLELFDTGKIKQKLIKNTRDNVRSEDLFGQTPTNMMLFGTPVKLLNGSRTEDEFFDMQEIGYARRCFYGYSRHRHSKTNQTAQDMYKIYHDPKTGLYLTQLNDRFRQLADLSLFGQELKMKQDTLMKLYEYRIACQQHSDTLSEFDELQRSEIAHRYFKVAKLAAAYAFIDRTTYITDDHLKYAIAMAEMSGHAFERILNRDLPFVKLANYICSVNRELTHVDLMNDLPFYKGSEIVRKDMMTMAIAHGYKNGMYIKTEVVDGIQFFTGKKVAETDLEKLRCAVSNRITEGYTDHEAPFTKLSKMVTTPGLHWCNHFLKKGYRSEDTVVPGCNMVVLDVEGSVDIPTAQLLLKDYTWLMHTTKRHTSNNHRFRIIMPLSHMVELDRKEYRGFMKNIYEWLPFDVDTATSDRCRKWLTHKGKSWYNEGEHLLDALQFVPKTKKAEDQKKLLAGQTNLTALERWAVNQAEDGNRNHTLARHAFTMVEMGYDLDIITSKVLELNEKLSDPLDESEIHRTILISVNKRIAERNAA
jgi:hypothetical protein